MKRRDRSMSFFTMSALDVVATATGVFVLFVVILLPYYLQSFDATAETTARRAATQQIRLEIENATQAIAREQREADEARAEAERLENARRALAAQGGERRRRAARLEAEAEDDRREAERLRAVARRRVIRELDLVFVIDTTASMSRAIAEMSRMMSGLVRILERLVPSLRIGFVAYRDYDVGRWVTRPFGLRSTRTELNEILRFAAGLGPPNSGGRSVTEAVFRGLADAIRMPRRPGAKQVLIVIGDAAAHPYERQATLSLASRFVNGGPGRSVSTLFITTIAYLRFGRGDREFFAELARAGRGTAHRHAGNMMEQILQSVLID